MTDAARRDGTADHDASYEAMARQLYGDPTAPRRIQLRRVKGWRLPLRAVPDTPTAEAAFGQENRYD